VNINANTSINININKATDQKPNGELKMTLDYDPDGKSLKVIVFGIRRQAKIFLSVLIFAELSSNFLFSNSLTSEKDLDLYIKLYLLPETRKSSKKKTKVVKGTLSPVFNETFVYHLEEYEKKGDKVESLEAIVCYDSGFSKTHHVGRVEIPLSDVSFFPIFLFFSLSLLSSPLLFFPLFHQSWN